MLHFYPNCVNQILSKARKISIFSPTRLKEILIRNMKIAITDMLWKCILTIDDFSVELGHQKKNHSTCDGVFSSFYEPFDNDGIN